eukprot:5381371-Pyramimonas_sp.AAC.2
MCPDSRGPEAKMPDLLAAPASHRGRRAAASANSRPAPWRAPRLPRQGAPAPTAGRLDARSPGFAEQLGRRRLWTRQDAQRQLHEQQAQRWPALAVELLRGDVLAAGY